MGRPRPLGAPAGRDRRHAAARDPRPLRRRAAGLAHRSAPRPRPRSRDRPPTTGRFEPERGAARARSPTSAWSPSRPSAARRLPAGHRRRRRRAPLRPRDAEARPGPCHRPRHPRRRATRSSSTPSRGGTWSSSRASPTAAAGAPSSTCWTIPAQPMGARLLREWILRPLVELERIQDRLDAVEELAFRTVDRGRFREAPRPPSRTSTASWAASSSGTAGPRDLIASGRSLRALPAAREKPSRECQAPLLRALVPRSWIPPSTSPTTWTRPSSTSLRRLARGRRRHPARASTPSSTSSARISQRRTRARSRRSRSASGSAPASPPSRSASTACSATTSRSASRTSGLSPPTTCASRRSRAGSASSPRSSRSTRRRCSGRRAHPRARGRALRGAARRDSRAGARRVQQTARAAAAVDVLAALAEAATPPRLRQAARRPRGRVRVLARDGTR